MLGFLKRRQVKRSVRRSIPAGMRVYAVGDIHGRADLLDTLHGMILDDARSADTVGLYIVYLGDYIDRGPDSRGVISALCRGPLPGFTAIHLMGNHEEAMLAYLDGEADGFDWIQFGGHSTLLSYGIQLGEAGDVVERLNIARERLRSSLPAGHERFLRSLKLSLTVGDYLFVHAGIRPGIPLRSQSRRDLLWIRDDFLEASQDHGHVVVHGHTIVPHPDRRANRICIDTGAYASGRLTCLVLEDETVRFLST